VVFLPELIGAAALALLAALPVIEESATRLDRLLLAGPSMERYSTVTVPVPAKPPEHSHYRLRVNAAGRGAWLDGARLAPNEDGDFDLLNLNPKRPSRVFLPGWVKEAVLLETPRVFVTRHEIIEPAARLWVRNSLENTVNVYATVTGSSGAVLEASATVPPGYTQIVTLSGARGIPGGPWRITLEKQEEAMEGGYQFVKTVEQRTGTTVNSYGKP
jgi:hypothetical protein